MIRVLLVDDHPPTLDVTRRVLEKAGFDVCTATSVREAVELGTREGVHVLVCDIGLPDGTGLDVLEQIRRVKQLPAIAVSGYGMIEDIERATAAGFAHYFVKPYRITALIDAVWGLVVVA
jgi:CheY-like chemotaxis protein